MKIATTVSTVEQLSTGPLNQSAALKKVNMIYVQTIMSARTASTVGFPHPQTDKITSQSVCPCILKMMALSSDGGKSAVTILLR